VTAASVAQALGAAYPAGGWWRSACPVHGSTAATLALRDAPRGLVVVCHAGCGRRAIMAELARRGLLTGDAAAPDPLAVERDRQAAERRRQRRIAEALDFWHHETADPHGTAVERYWVSRGLPLPLPPTIRASRSWLRHPEGGSRPAMIALVEHQMAKSKIPYVEHADLGPVAIHRTWIAVDGSAKASFRVPRMALGPVGGAAIRLAPAGETLVVAEGVETAASVMAATGLPAWAAISAGGIEKLILPPLPLAAAVLVAADNDRSGTGIRAARTAAERWVAEGRHVRIALPPVLGSDFNDALQGKANDGRG
jgi:putative DNA primase/helicase